MHRSFLAALAALALLLPAATQAAHTPRTGTFTIAPAEGHDPARAVQVTLAWAEGRIATDVVALSRLGGLVADGYGLSQTVPVRFALGEEAGTLVFVGTARGGRAEGRFTFEPSVPFADQVERRVMDRPDDGQMIALALQGTGLTALDAFATMLGARARAQVVDLLVAGVTPAYVIAMADLGYGDLSAGQLIALRSRGVTPAYAARVQALGYRAISPAQLLQLRQDGVSAGFIRQANEGRAAPRSVDALVQLRRLDGR